MERNPASDPIDLRLDRDRWLPRAGLLNGCFDLLHPGHVLLFEEAAAKVDRLVVAIDSDERVRVLKGDGHPLRPFADRALLVASLRAVWRVVEMSEEWPLGRLLETIRPDVYFHRREEPNADDLEAAKSAGIHVYFLPRHGEWSTSEEIARLGMRHA